MMNNIFYKARKRPSSIIREQRYKKEKEILLHHTSNCNEHSQINVNSIPLGNTSNIIAPATYKWTPTEKHSSKRAQSNCCSIYFFLYLIISTPKLSSGPGTATWGFPTFTRTAEIWGNLSRVVFAIRWATDSSRFWDGPSTTSFAILQLKIQ